MTTDHGPWTTDQGPQTTDYRPQTTDHGPQTTDHGPRTTDYGPATIPVAVAYLFLVRGSRITFNHVYRTFMNASIKHSISARLLICLGFSTLSLLWAQSSHAQSSPPSPHQQQWEYRVMVQSDLLRELMIKLKKDKVYDFDVTEKGYSIDLGAMFALAPYLDKFMTDKFNQMGAEGWQLAGSIGEKSDRIVFMRPKQ
jgi:hypothetical protein